VNTDLVMSNQRNSVKILFLGQCLQYGYTGVEATTTFPNLAALLLQTQFPNSRFKFDFKFLYHPSGLKTLLRHRLRFTEPDITVISLPAMFAARPWRVNALYEMAPELVDTARSFLQQVEARVRGGANVFADTLLDKTFKLHAPITLDAYERLVEEAIEQARQVSSSRLVLMGPGHFNEDTHEQYAVHSPELWKAVNQMILRLGKRLDLPVINAQEALSGQGNEVFISNNHRFSGYGHEIVAREVAEVLTSQISYLSAKGIS
jgi:hypothetical protein